MCKILLSINPEHVENILNGSKRFEFRKIKLKQAVDKIVIYSTSPVMKVVGEVEVVEVIDDFPDKVWELTSRYAGVQKNFYDKYYLGKARAIAYRLGRVTPYVIPREIGEYGIASPPQSFAYIK